MSSQIKSQNIAVFLAAGGTGGHVFPALHTAGALKARGFDVWIITDERGLSLLPKKCTARRFTLPLLLPVL